MNEKVSIDLIQSIVNHEKNLFILFRGEEPILINRAFSKFFSVSSLEEYIRNYGEFLNSFVPHPSYFHKDVVKPDESWFDAVLNMEEEKRIVSMMTTQYNPHAFSITIDKSVEGYTIVNLADITQDLIKRIMIEGHANIDKKSGAYDKDYFLHVVKSFEDAAVFNKKVLSAISISIDEDKKEDFARDAKALREFADNIKKNIRNDDMLVYWGDGKFLLIHLVENEGNARQMLSKLQKLINTGAMKSLNCKLNMALQEENESVKSIIKRALI